MKFGLKWVHMARYELILRLDGALWLTIISKTPLTPRKAMEGPTNSKESKKNTCKGQDPPSPAPPLYAHVLTGHFGTATSKSAKQQARWQSRSRQSSKVGQQSREAKQSRAAGQVGI